MKNLIILGVCACVVALTAHAEAVLKPPRHGGLYVVAHRGAHEGIPENTLAAYRKAIDLGCDFVEIDVRTTKDGKFVSVHNREVDAYMTDGTKGLVKDFTLEELKALDIGSRVGPEWKDERIPTFEEILDLCQGKIGIYLDLKEAPVEPLIAAIKEHGMEKDVIWYSDPDELKRMKMLCPDCIEMPDPGPEEFLDALLEDLEPRVVASVWRFYSPTFVQKCHDAGAIVIVDESDPSCWEDAIAWKSDGIQTDHPAELINFLEENERR
ncbi:MAG: glycerophosphodiester phosphodiesterase family protein [Candidatus Hydrogenedentes bacterium]|nr:glycerophosphodiester phosphodiesterase family protein [Candidatus Hydrogenedentota bacterium]